MVKLIPWLMAGAMAAVVCSPSAAAIETSCADLIPPAGAIVHRGLVAQDLVRLRDIGPVDPLQASEGLFAISPDGERVAFQLRRGEPATNHYCLGIVIVDLRPESTPRLIDTGGELIRETYDFRGKAAFPTGIATVITPHWSPDGSWVAYLKRVDDRTQVWRAYANGSGSGPLTRSTNDVLDFRISANGRTLVFSTAAALDAAKSAISTEGLSGWHFDARYSPSTSSRPFPIPSLAKTIRAQSIAGGIERAATADEAALLTARAAGVKQAYGDLRAVIEVSPGSIFPDRGQLVVEGPHGMRQVCADAVCADASQPWWTSRGHVRFFRYEGWAHSVTAIYDWRSGSARPRRLYGTDDVLVDCAPRGDALLCLREGSLTPRRFEQLDPGTGQRRLLFDPNPEFAGLTLGKVERLHIRNRYGEKSISDLVLPVGYQPGHVYPTIVVQYTTRGFLRGGTGNDYPIQAFANRGYAVVSFGRASIARPDLNRPVRSSCHMATAIG